MRTEQSELDLAFDESEDVKLERRMKRRSAFSDFVYENPSASIFELKLAALDFDLSEADADQAMLDAWIRQKNENEKQSKVACQEEKSKEPRSPVVPLPQKKDQVNMKAAVMFVVGFIGFCAMIVYQWLPFFGALSIITGIIGFFTGSSVAGRAFVLGVILLGVRYLVAIIFQKMIDRG